MKHLPLLALLFSLAGPAAAQTDLKCPEFKPAARAVKTLRMEPVRRGKDWLEGTQKSANSVSCDARGMKTEEAEYDGKTLTRKISYVYKEKEEAKAFCVKLKSEEKREADAGDEARPTADEFCRDNAKKDFGAVLVYDISPSQDRDAAAKPVRLVFRLYDRAGRVAEEHAYDLLLTLESVTQYAYDKDGALTSTTVNDFSGRQLRRETFARDSVTSSATRLVYSEHNELSEKTVDEMRETGALRKEVRSTYDTGEQPLAATETHYDAKGSPEQQFVYDADRGEPKYAYSYAYKYDAKGNWTEERKARLITYNGTYLTDSQYAPEITKREILYYEPPARKP